MNINNKNLIIAQFMGYDLDRIVDELPTDKDGNYTTDGNKWVWVNELQYNYNWDSLMRVVCKIEKMGFDVKIQGISCSVNRLCESDTIVGLVCGNRGEKLNIVYETVLKFIIWYNENHEQ